MNKTRKLLQMKERIEESELEIAKLQGKLEDRERQLKKVSGCNNVIGAKSILKKLKNKLKRIEFEFEKGVKKLEKKYEW